MARYNEILVGRYNRFLQKLLQMKAGPPAAQLSGDIQVTLPLFHGVETKYLQGWNRFATFNRLGASVGNQTGFRLRNPLTSNVIAVIEAIQVMSSTAALAIAVEIEKATADLATLNNALVVPLDTRQQGDPGSALAHSFTQAVAVNLGGLRFVFQTELAVQQHRDFITTVNREVVLLPGMAIQATSITANSPFGAGFHWRERFLEESERT